MAATAALLCFTLAAAAHASIGATLSFTPDGVASREPTTLRSVLSNTDNQPATILAVTMSLPAGLFVAPLPNLVNTCGGSLAVTPGGTTLTLSGGVIPAATGAGPGRCEIAVDVVADAVGSFVATLAAGSVTSSRGNLPATVEAPVTAHFDSPITGSLTFSPALVHGNPSSEAGASTVTITLTNPNYFTLTGLSFTDILPDELPRVPATCWTRSRFRQVAP